MPALLSGFSGETASAGLSVLMILAKATVVLLAALLVTRAMERGSAISRHLVWFVSLGALLLIPVLASWSPLRLAILPAESFSVAPLRPLSSVPAPQAPVAVPTPSGGVTTAPSVPNVEATVNTVRNIVSPKMQWFGILRDPTVLFAIWAAVAVLFASWLAYGAYSVHRIIRRSRVLDAPDWMNPLWEVADRLELARAPRLVRSVDAKMP